METKPTFWWVKSATKDPKTTPVNDTNSNQLTVPKLDLDVPPSSLAEFLEKEQNLMNSNRSDNSDVDIASIIEEIKSEAQKSPLGPYQLSGEERSIDEIMKHIELESSKHFEQLSQRSRTSQNISDIDSKVSTPTPKSLSPLPIDNDNNNNNDISSNSSSDNEDSYSDDFSIESRIQSIQSPEQQQQQTDNNGNRNETDREIVEINRDLIETLEQENQRLHEEIRLLKLELQQTNELLEQTKMNLISNNNHNQHQQQQQQRSILLCSPEINQELERTLEELKDSKEINTALQLQLDTINRTHLELKCTNDELLTTNKTLERRLYELDTTLEKYKNELQNLQSQRDKLIENETNLNQLLEIEKLQCKSLKLQNDKDTKCIQDLNRQIKEMERIIARKHPDSVSALIVAAKHDDDKTTPTTTTTTTRKLLEDRIRVLEEEATIRNQQSTQIFLDIQEKFNQMKSKYEHHIEDLELHVNDLKQQLKVKKINTFDVYTQTTPIVEKQLTTTTTTTTTIGVQTDQKLFKKNEIKQETHLLQTIRGLQTDLTNKEKVVLKLQREIDELKKTIRKLQKERENSLKNLNERREFRSYPEKLSQQVNNNNGGGGGGGGNNNDDEVRFVRAERDKIKQQLCRIEDDYQTLKNKRLHDLNALQEAHEREIANYVKSIDPLRQQLELQQVQIVTLENQLKSTKDELLIVHVERDHLNQQLIKQKNNNQNYESNNNNNNNNNEVESLQKKIEFLEKRYEERETRLRTIVHGLVQKTNQSCEQCAERQRQLIAYKIELDQLLATLRAIKS